jgi:fumarate hydratase subunit beta
MVPEITLPLADEIAATLRVGDEVTLSGWVLGGRDQACARLFKMIEAREDLPVELSNQLIYLVGPTPPRPGKVIGSAGPTTAGRLDPFLPAFLKRGLRGFIGKGYLGQEVKDALVRFRAIYFGAIGGSGALLASAITEVKMIAFEELLTEALRGLRLDRFPVVVLNDIYGGDLYSSVRKTT